MIGSTQIPIANNCMTVSTPTMTQALRTSERRPRCDAMFSHRRTHIQLTFRRLTRGRARSRRLFLKCAALLKPSRRRCNQQQLHLQQQQQQRGTAFGTSTPMRRYMRASALLRAAYTYTYTYHQLGLTLELDGAGLGSAKQLKAGALPSTRPQSAR